MSQSMSLALTLSRLYRRRSCVTVARNPMHYICFCFYLVHGAAEAVVVWQVATCLLVFNEPARSCFSLVFHDFLSKLGQQITTIFVVYLSTDDFFQLVTITILIFHYFFVLPFNLTGLSLHTHSMLYSHTLTVYFFNNCIKIKTKYINLCLFLNMKWNICMLFHN